MGKKVKDIFVTFHSKETGKEQLAVIAKGVVCEPIFLLMDNIPFIRLGRKKEPYLKIEDAINWLENELRYNPAYPKGSGLGNEVLAKLREMKSKFESGDY